MSDPSVEVVALDHVEFYVADLDNSLARFVDQFGLLQTGKAAGSEEATAGDSVCLGCGSTSIVLTAPASESSPVADFLARHGEGVANLCVRTPLVGPALLAIEAHGHNVVSQPVHRTIGEESVVTAELVAFGDVTLTLIERAETASTLPFGFDSVAGLSEAGPLLSAIAGIDHLAVCLPSGELQSAVAMWTEALGFLRTFEERVVVGGQAMDSVVVQDTGGALVLTLLCQDPELAPGQIAAFVEAHGGAGVQHVAFRTPDICEAVASMQGAGVEFIEIPTAYYDGLKERLGGDDDDEAARLSCLGVLKDCDEWGTILQVFTRSIHDRGTLFFEFVERQGARTFGSGNIRSLYEAVDRDVPLEKQMRSNEDTDRPAAESERRE